jgi:hypothetical protein
VAASVAAIRVLLRVVTHGQEETIVTTICFISHIVWFEIFKLKTPRFSRMVGASVCCFNINLSGRYRIANVICMVNFNMSIFAISFRKGGAVK